MLRGLIFWLMYLAPTLIAGYRAQSGKPVTGSILALFLFNLFLGWTVVAWFLSLANAFGRNPVAWVARRAVKGLPSGPPVNSTSGAVPTSSGLRACSQCGATGQMMCSTCGGRGSWYDPPQGEYGTAQLRSCGACLSSGRIRCAYCGGSGQVL